MKCNDAIKYSVKAIFAVRHSLQELSLDICREYRDARPLELSYVLPALPQIRKAYISAPTLMIGPTLGRMTQLKKLALHCSSPLQLDPYTPEGGKNDKCRLLPAGLEKLSAGWHSKRVPALLKALTSLQGLALHNLAFTAGGSRWHRLRHLTSLRELCLSK